MPDVPLPCLRRVVSGKSTDQTRGVEAHRRLREKISMIPTVQKPIMGNEKVLDPRQPLSALSQFYRALNQRDITAMQENWDRSDDAVMDNPLGGNKEEAGLKFVRFTSACSQLRTSFILSFTTIASRPIPRYSLQSGANGENWSTRTIRYSWRFVRPECFGACMIVGGRSIIMAQSTIPACWLRTRTQC